MWARFKGPNISKDCDKLRAIRGSFNVNEEYLSAFRTKSYADIFTKAQLLISDRSSSSSYCTENIYDILLEPGQETITHFLESTIFSKKPSLKGLLHNYFDISAEASKICTQLLTNINQIHSNYQFIRRALDMIEDYYSPEQFEFVMSELNSFNHLKNPFSNPNQHDFKLIHDRYSLVSNYLKLKRKKVARKIKLIKYFRKAGGICITICVGLAAVTAIILAAHTFTGIIMGPAIFSFSSMRLKKKISNFRVFQSKFLRKFMEHLDVTAKGTYILNMDFETMSRLVSRLHDEIEHSKAMIKFCLERREERFPLQNVVKELRNSEVGFKKLVEELEEHVYLCLVTINRARVLVIKEIASHDGSLVL